ncbi:hypothetical protein I552_6143 [Mycobacterium xenopi 3993]|nr:hypothetical protein I552_6143 [Mycobacterium xenopi 3993]
MVDERHGGSERRSRPASGGPATSRRRPRPDRDVPAQGLGVPVGHNLSTRRRERFRRRATDPA